MRRCWCRVHRLHVVLAGRAPPHRRRLGKALVCRSREVDRISTGEKPGLRSAGAIPFHLRALPRDLPATARAPSALSMLQKFDERNHDLLVSINGELLHRDRAGISPFDSAVQGGDAVWEGLRLYNGRIFKLHEHLARLRNSARALAFAEIPADEVIIDQLRRTLQANTMDDGVHIRLTLT